MQRKSAISSAAICDRTPDTLRRIFKTDSLTLNAISARFFTRRREEKKIIHSYIKRTICALRHTSRRETFFFVLD